MYLDDGKINTMVRTTVPTLQGEAVVQQRFAEVTECFVLLYRLFGDQS